ncbi:MAG TPA: GAF domain-containing protein [Thermoanaerobaculia bacterium]|nr:GAF domain-containing protein [Thermoanaerobaculia bacterium]
MVTLSDEERAALFGAAQAGVVASAALEEPAEVGFDQAVERLEGAADRDEVGQLLLAFFGHHFDRVVLLGVRREATTGWLATGEGLDRRRLETLSIPFDRPSIFLNLRQGSAFHLGPLPPLPAHRPLVALLGGDQPRECLLLPVRLGGRLVAALYADRGGDRLAGLDLESLRRLTELAGAALERAILLKRREKSGSAGG